MAFCCIGGGVSKMLFCCIGGLENWQNFSPLPIFEWNSPNRNVRKNYANIIHFKASQTSAQGNEKIDTWWFL